MLVMHTVFVAFKIELNAWEANLLLIRINIFFVKDSLCFEAYQVVGLSFQGHVAINLDLLELICMNKFYHNKVLTILEDL